METDNGAAFAKLRESAEKYAELLRFFALLVCGTAMGPVSYTHLTLPTMEAV